MAARWICPTCKRSFTRANQRHACGTGDREAVLRNRPPELVELYGALEETVKAFGRVEVVARDRYVLFRSARIFADLTVMTDCLRLAIHLSKEVSHPLFFKVVADRRHVTHVAKLRSPSDLEAMTPLLRRAFGESVA